MVKIPSIEADVTINTADAGGTSIVAGYRMHLRPLGSRDAVTVRVLDGFSSRKSHRIEPGDDAYVVFLLIDHPTVSYDQFKRGARFEIVDETGVVGAGLIQARVD